MLNKLFEDRYKMYQDGTKEYVPEPKGSYFRCTNFTLEAFGIVEKECIYSMSGIDQTLRENGYFTQSIGYLYMAIVTLENVSTYKRKNGDYVKFNEDFYYERYGKYKENMSLNKFGKAFPKGKFFVGTAGHSMALINGVLWDLYEKGFNKRRIQAAYEVFDSKKEYDYVQDNMYIKIKD